MIEVAYFASVQRHERHRPAMSETGHVCATARLVTVDERHAVAAVTGHQSSSVEAAQREPSHEPPPMSAVEGWAITVAILAVIAMVPTRTLLTVILAVVALPVALALLRV